SGVALGDSIYRALTGAHLPRIVAAFVGEAAVDLPDKLLTVVAALLIAQGLPQQRAPRSTADLDLGEAFTFVIRSDRWLRKLLAGAACLLLFWLIVPFLLLVGYIVEIARRVRSGARALPPWDHPWQNIKDGFKLIVALLIWTIPSVLLGIPAAIVEVRALVTFPCASFSGAYLVGRYAALTDRPVLRAETVNRRSVR